MNGNRDVAEIRARWCMLDVFVEASRLSSKSVVCGVLAFLQWEAEHWHGKSRALHHEEQEGKVCYCLE